MTDAYDRDAAGHLVAVMQVPMKLTSQYGILSVISQNGRMVKAGSIVEKPAPEKAPSQLAVVGRYILDPAIFGAIARQGPGAGGEIQLTDAITSSGVKTGIAGFRFSGRRFDCGSKQGMLAATLFLARRNPEYAEVLEEYLTVQES